MKSRASYLLSLALILLAAPGRASESEVSSLIPDFMRMQYAGQAGLISVGTGYSYWHKKAESSLNYGFVPLSIADRRVHVLSERNALSLARLRPQPRLALEPAIAGVTANVSLGNQYELFLPSSQRNYYWPDALYFWFFTGAKLDYLPARPTHFHAVGTQIEVGTLNQYIRSYRNNRSVDLGDILSLAVSTQIYL